MNMKRLTTLAAIAALVTATAQADITVNSTSGLATPADIANAINAELALGNDATVTGEFSGATVGLALVIPEDRTVVWQAAYSGNVGQFLVYNYSPGTLVVADGAAVTNNGAGNTLYTMGDLRVTGGTVVAHTETPIIARTIVVSGGEVATEGNPFYLLKANPSIVLLGGTVSGAYTIVKYSAPVVAEWDGVTTDPFANSTTGIAVSGDATDPAAVWAIQNGAPGILCTASAVPPVETFTPVPGITLRFASSAALINLADPNPDTANGGGNWTYDSVTSTYTILNNAAVTVTDSNAGSQRRIAITATASVTLHDATISGLANNQTPLLLNSGSTLTLTLLGDNTLTGGANYPAIQTTAATLHVTADSTGTLTANGGADAAGIGGVYHGNGGTVIIDGGDITANGGYNAAGIGGGNNSGGGSGGNGGTVIINGGTVTANGDRYAAGIGGGLYGNGGTVTISGGTVHANGGNIGEGAGIGGGSNGNGGTVTISGGIVTAVGGWAGADIGAGRSNFTYLNGGTLTVSGNTLLDADKFENNGGDKTLVTILGGVVRDGNTYTVHGTVLLLDDTLTLGANQTLHIPDGATLVISELAAHPTSTVTGPGRLFRLDQLPPPPRAAVYQG